MDRTKKSMYSYNQTELGWRILYTLWCAELTEKHDISICPLVQKVGHWKFHIELNEKNMIYDMIWYVIHHINIMGEVITSLLTHLLRKTDPYLTRIFYLDLFLKWLWCTFEHSTVILVDIFHIVYPYCIQEA